jgi:hypothetical protein
MRRRLALAVLGLMALMNAPAGASLLGTVGSDPSWIGLAKGQVGDYEWSVKIKRPEGPAGAGPEGALRPCLLVGTKWEVGSYSFRRSKYRACAQRQGHLTATDPPLIGSGIQPKNASGSGLTAVGMVLAPAVRRARVTLSSGSQVTVPLHHLTPDQARSAKLGRRLRYAAFAVRGEWCVERIVTLNSAGTPLWDSGLNEEACGA